MGNVQKHFWYTTIIILYGLYYFTNISLFKILGHLMVGLNVVFVLGGILIFKFLELIRTDMRMSIEAVSFYINLAKEFSIYNIILGMIIITMLVYFGNLILALSLFIMLVLLTSSYNKGLNLMEQVEID